jgi:predicted small metal-binding protein
MAAIRNRALRNGMFCFRDLGLHSPFFEFLNPPVFANYKVERCGAQIINNLAMLAGCEFRVSCRNEDNGLSADILQHCASWTAKSRHGSKYVKESSIQKIQERVPIHLRVYPSLANSAAFPFVEESSKQCNQLAVEHAVETNDDDSEPSSDCEIYEWEAGVSQKVYSKDDCLHFTCPVSRFPLNSWRDQNRTQYNFQTGLMMAREQSASDLTDLKAKLLWQPRTPFSNRLQALDN